MSSSFARSSAELESNLWLEIDPKQVERVARRIGAERCAGRDAETERCMSLPLAERKAAPPGVQPPGLAVAGADGGRLQVRTGFEGGADAPEQEEALPEEDGRKGKHWREDKIGVLMAMASPQHAEDPCPEVPAALLDPQRIAKLARELKARKSASADAGADGAAPSVPGAADSGQGEAPAWEPPTVVSRDLAATRRPWAAFGPMLAAAAWRRGFYGAARRAFVGDGSEHVWTMWRSHFSSFVPVLDIIHAISYVYAAAMASRPFAEGWACYARWMGWVWKGEAGQALEQMRARQEELGPVQAGDGETHPRAVVAAGVRYLDNHKEKMRYAEYRRQGLPITSSYVESAVKQFNQRLKGTEKFWTEEGAEALLQLRADHLGTTPVMEEFWRTRQASETGTPRYNQAV